MNILFVAPLVPFPIFDGDRQRSFHLLQAMAKRHAVHFLGFLNNERERQDLDAIRKMCVTAEGVVISRGQILRNCLRTWSGPLPLNVSGFTSAAMHKAIAETVIRHTIQCIHVYRLRMAPYALAAQVPHRVLDYTDAMVRHYQNRTVVESAIPKRWYLEHQGKRLGRYEVEVSYRFDATLISSALDRETLVQQGANPAMIEVTNGVDTLQYSPVKKLTRQPVVLFLGNLEYPPNFWGLQRFCKMTWPLIKQQLPEATLRVIGKIPAKVAAHPDLQGTGIQLLGTVPELKPHFQQTRVAICPLEVATGRQFKVIEYFASALPVVVTSLVAKNVEAKHQQHCLVADTPQATAAAVVALCQNQALAEKLRQAARLLAENKFTWSRAADKLLKLYRAWEKPASKKINP